MMRSGSLPEPDLQLPNRADETEERRGLHLNESTEPLVFELQRGKERK